MTTTGTRIDHLLTPLRQSIIDKPPYISGTLQPPPSSFSLFYKTTIDDHTARHIDLAHASFDELEQLAQACKPTETVTGESACNLKARNMDVECFAPSSGLMSVQTTLEKIIKDYSFEGFRGRERLRIELNKLTVYSKGSFSHPQINTPLEEEVIGSLIIIFPTPHEGGTQRLRHDGHEWTIDHGYELANVRKPSIGYLALLDNAIKHEVMQVTSGHRVTLTYNLYLDDGETHPGSHDLLDEGAFRDAFEALLENPEFLPDGGTLGFGLRHVYPVSSDEKNRGAAVMPKGSDAVVYWTTRRLGFEPLFYVLYEWRPRGMESTEGGLINYTIDFGEYEPDRGSEAIDVTKIIRREGGIVVCEDPDSYRREEGAYDRPEKVEWVTPKTTFNGQESKFMSMWGNEPILGYVYGCVCLIVRIGKAGERLMYPTSGQLEKVWEREGNERPSAFWSRREYSAGQLNMANFFV